MQYSLKGTVHDQCVISQVCDADNASHIGEYISYLLLPWAVFRITRLYFAFDVVAFLWSTLGLQSRSRKRLTKNAINRLSYL